MNNILRLLETSVHTSVSSTQIYLLIVAITLFYPN